MTYSHCAWQYLYETEGPEGIGRQPVVGEGNAMYQRRVSTAEGIAAHIGDRIEHSPGVGGSETPYEARRAWVRRIVKYQ